MADENQQAEQGNTGGPKKSKLPLLFAIINSVVMLGGVALVYMSTLGHVEKSTSNEELNKELEDFRESLRENSVLFAMDTFNANLDGLPRRMIRMDISLEMLDEEGFEEIIGHNAETRDVVLRVISSKRFRQIETVQGKLQLKNEIIAALNGVMENGVVKNIYFTDFVVQ